MAGHRTLSSGKHLGKTYDHVIEHEPSYVAFIMYSNNNDLALLPAWSGLCRYVEREHGGIMTHGKFQGETFKKVLSDDPDYARFLVEQHASNERYTRFVEYCTSQNTADQLARLAQQCLPSPAAARSPINAAQGNIADPAMRGDDADSSMEDSSAASCDRNSQNAVAEPERAYLQKCCRKILKKAAAPVPWWSLARKFEQAESKSKFGRKLLRDRATLEHKLLASLKTSWLSKTDDKVSLRKGSKFSDCKICMSNPVDAVFNPCGHLTCMGCARRFQMEGRCPICRQSVANVIRTFYP
mmetsp:Transcript_46027/g.127837  ORF Transcript_46027/g.127837 Transcript_46027/m.127837 type:complete len:298 (+) Transcript_46027:158-1051(+)